MKNFFALMMLFAFSMVVVTKASPFTQNVKAKYCQEIKKADPVKSILFSNVNTANVSVITATFQPIYFESKIVYCYPALMVDLTSQPRQRCIRPPTIV